MLSGEEDGGGVGTLVDVASLQKCKANMSFQYDTTKSLRIIEVIFNVQPYDS